MGSLISASRFRDFQEIKPPLARSGLPHPEPLDLAIQRDSEAQSLPRSIGGGRIIFLDVPYGFRLSRNASQLDSSCVSRLIGSTLISVAVKCQVENKWR